MVNYMIKSDYRLNEVYHIGLGPLTRINWTPTIPDFFLKLQEGFNIIPNKLRIRSLRQDEIEEINSIRTFFGLSPLVYWAGSYAVLELRGEDNKDLLDQLYKFDLVLLSFRLLKQGGIFLQDIYYLSGGKERDSSVGVISFRTVPLFYDPYIMTYDEIEKVIQIFNQLEKIDLQKIHSFRISYDRFNRYYNDANPEDQLIDLCIGFEALYCKGEKFSPMGSTIGLACSMLIGENSDERNRIYQLIESAFSLRNDVVHGKEFDNSRIEDLLPEFEDYLRRSILRLIL